MAQTPDTRTGDRIAKLLARAGVASRREVERMIEEGRIALNGAVLDTPATVLRSLQGVTVDGQPAALPEPTRLFLYHKPNGLLVTERDPKGRTTIYDRLPRDLPRLVPVGRLDLNTEGLLLLTTDGGFKRQLELPSTGVERSYRARAYGNVTQQQLEELAEGVEIEGIRYGSIDANIERRTGANVWIEITITEGKNREVRRVLEYLGLQVSRLIRTRYGPFVLGDLPVGGVGEVKQHEVVAFRRTLKGGAPDESVIEAPRDGFRTAPSVDRNARARTRVEGGIPMREAQERPKPTRTPAPTGEGRRAPRRSEAVPTGIATRPARPGTKPASGRSPGRDEGSRGGVSAGRKRGEEPGRTARADDRAATRPPRGGTARSDDRASPRTQRGDDRTRTPRGNDRGRTPRADDRATPRSQGSDDRTRAARGGEATDRPRRNEPGVPAPSARPPKPGARPPRRDGTPSGNGPRPTSSGGRPPRGRRP
ncbi:23S rRNA pseudouridine2605 synthase [Sphingomonas insulae]|uniref:Pseudouridine synthase n=1 Tax=Sphingomonas insulae TaxID=424800 RepID=A0ABN1HRG6_9SPHN|nr:pseudouridine synthase [Sphingomonas insulae]NIJ29183.1 23S rRNA pseudouridine2605 synthase [Sphingomonas insulae]